MTGFAVVATNVKGTGRHWVADEKSALYLAQLLLASNSVVLVHHARAPHSTIAVEGAAPVFKADYRGIAIDSLS